MLTTLDTQDGEFAVANCYQCGKCTAGCPVADCMDRPPHQIFRLLQLGYVEKALRACSIWQCVSCFTCATRCPQSVDCVGILDELRQRAVREGLAPPQQRRIVLFQQAFLENIRRHGRLNEIDLISRFKAAGFLSDLSVKELLRGSMLGPKMMQRHKLHFGSAKLRDAGVVERIFERCAAPATGEHTPERQEA